MSINSLFTPSFVAASNNNQVQTQIPPFDVEVSGGEFLDNKDLARRIVKLALGTTDEQNVDDFLRQSGFELKDAPPRLNENGKSVYRFVPDDKFLKSIESFKQTGTAIPLNDAPKTGSNAEVRQTNAQTMARPPISPRTVHQPKPKQVFRAAPNTVAPKKSDYTDVELDPKQFIAVATGKDGKLHTIVLGDGDPREEIYRAAVNKQFGAAYPADVIEQYLTGIYQNTKGSHDDNSVYYKGTNNVQPKEVVVNSLLTAAQNKTPYKFGINNGTGKDLARLDIQMHGTEADKLQLKINDSLKAIDEKIDKIKPQNLLHQSMLEMQRESEKKAAIEALTAASNIDFRSNETNAEKFANQTADVIERTTRAYLEINPLYRYLPSSVKDQMVKGTVGFVRGGYSLYATAKGAGDFVNDAVTDGVLSALKTTGVGQSLGIDVDKAQAALQQKRGRDAEFVRAISGMGTAQMSQSEAAFQTEKDKGLTIRPFDYPNWATKGGELTAKALPYIAIGIATGGVGSAVGAATESGALTMLAQMGTSAVGTGVLGGAETYSQTRQYAPAIRAAGMSAAQGAVAPLTAKLGLGGDLAANTVYAVALGKLEGKSDGEIFQDAVLQNALGLSMAHGTKAHEAIAAKLGKETFTQSEAQTALKQIFTEEVRTSANTQAQEAFRQIEVETVAEHLSKGGTLSDARETVNAKVGELRGRASDLQAKLRTAKQEIIAGWGAKNKLVTREQYAAADKLIQNRLRTPEGIEYRHSGVPLNNLPDIGIKATFHFEAAVGGFKEFMTAMKPELAKVGRTASVAEYEELYRTKAAEAGIKPSEVEIAKAKLTTRTNAELKADLDPTIRAGESINQAQERVKIAQEERIIRGRLEVFNALGETSPKVKLSENDKIYGNDYDAHTIEKHGAITEMKRSNAPIGTRTIEGRIYGDAPWGRAENFSYKWLDDTTMNQTINEYMEKNWDAIRWDLANNRIHQGTFDVGKAVGEGYYNSGQMGTGTRQAVYHKTSIARVLITLDQVEMQPVIITAYPTGKGQ